MIDFDAIRRGHEKWQSEAKQIFVPGVDPADLKAGQLVTISPNLRVGDRSYTESVLRILAVNTGHVQVKRMTGYRIDDRPIVLNIHEHHFYRADDFELPEEQPTA